MLKTVAALTVALIAILSTVNPAAAAQKACTMVKVPCPAGQTGTCWKQVCPPGDDDGGGDDGDGSGTGGDPITKCVYLGEEVACSGPSGTWSAAHACWLKPVDAQDPPPEGKKDEDGNWFYCTPPPPFIVQGAPPTIWIDGPGIVFVDPGPLAESVRGTLPYPKPDIHLAPKPPLLTYVGLETWLWTDPDQWNALTGGTSVGGATVTVTATPVRASWNLTEASVRCFSPGRAWVTGMSSDETTNCDYVFQNVSDGQPNDAFKVTAQLAYKVTWTCTGPCLGTEGSLGIFPGPISEAEQLRVGERQSVVIR